MARPIISREEARRLGVKRYFTGESCRNGHTAERYRSNDNCVECTFEHERKNRDKQKPYRQKWAKGETRKAYIEAYRQEHAEELRAYQKEYREKNADRIQEQTKEWKAKHPEHVTRQTDSRRRRLLRKATRPKPDRCEGCKIKTKALCFDHCHVSNEFRGWLCLRCNSALGMVKDSPETLRRLADYLEHKQYPVRRNRQSPPSSARSRKADCFEESPQLSINFSTGESQ